LSSFGGTYRLIGGRMRGPKDADRYSLPGPGDWGKSLYAKDFIEREPLANEENWIKLRSKTRAKVRDTPTLQSENRRAYSDQSMRATAPATSWQLERARKKYVPLKWAVPIKSESESQFMRTAPQGPIKLHTCTSRLRALEENGYEPRDLRCPGESTYKSAYVEHSLARARPHVSTLWPVSKPPPPPPPGETTIAPAPTNPARRREPSAFQHLVKAAQTLQ